MLILFINGNYISQSITGVIEKNCWAGLDEYFSSLIKALTMECEENSGSVGVKRKARRRRRATGPGISLQTHSSDHTSSTLQNSLNLPHINDNTGMKLMVQ